MKKMKKVGTTAEAVKTGLNETEYRHQVRIDRWLEAMPQAVRIVSECRAMQEGELLPIAQLEHIDGRSIDDIIVGILTTRYILNKNGDYSYTHSEDNSAPCSMRRQSLQDVQNALTWLLDYTRFVPQSDAVRFYAKFYRRGDDSARDVAKHAICAAMNAAE